MFKAVARRAFGVAKVVIHDPAVDRAGKTLAVLVIVRVLIALGASAEVASQVTKFFG